jgi:hypothetical protein
MFWNFWRNPLNILIAGAIVNVLAVVMAMPLGDVLVPLRVVLVVTGFVLAVIGVNHRLRRFQENIDDRTTTAAYLALGSFVLLLGYLASNASWDTWRLVLAIFTVVGLAGAVLVLLPQLVRRGILVVLVLYHFGGILTAIFSPATLNGTTCWTTGALWTYVYRPYLQFMYLNNAYHFYSPEPGPSTQLWFLVTYENPKIKPRWVVLPRRDDYPSKINYFRRIAMNESTNFPRIGLPTDFYVPRGRRDRRMAVRDKIPLPFDEASQLGQYREPREIDSKKYLVSYARHVARNPEYGSPDSPVKSVKVYRVLHQILTPGGFALGEEPYAPTTYTPVYMGEYDEDGRLLDIGDPLLYWVVPIQLEKNAQGELVYKDYVKVHAGTDNSPATEGFEEPAPRPGERK